MDIVVWISSVSYNKLPLQLKVEPWFGLKSLHKAGFLIIKQNAEAWKPRNGKRV